MRIAIITYESFCFNTMGMWNFTRYSYNDPSILYVVAGVHLAYKPSKSDNF